VPRGRIKPVPGVGGGCRGEEEKKGREIERRMVMDRAANGSGSSGESRERNRLKSTCLWRRLQWGGEHGRAMDPPVMAETAERSIHRRRRQGSRETRQRQNFG
jgi:hypothetical protein